MSPHSEAQFHRACSKRLPFSHSAPSNPCRDHSQTARLPEGQPKDAPSLVVLSAQEVKKGAITEDLLGAVSRA